MECRGNLSESEGDSGKINYKEARGIKMSEQKHMDAQGNLSKSERDNTSTPTEIPGQPMETQERLTVNRPSPLKIVREPRECKQKSQETHIDDQGKLRKTG